MLPFRSALMSIVYSPGGGPISLGPTGAGIGEQSVAATNTIKGEVWQAGASGTLNTLYVLAGATLSWNDYRLCIYEATSPTAIGALIGQTAPKSYIAAGATVAMRLLSPVSITSGNYYFIGIQPAIRQTMPVRTYAASDGQKFGTNLPNALPDPATGESSLGYQLMVWGDSEITPLSTDTLSVPERPYAFDSGGNILGGWVVGRAFYASMGGTATNLNITPGSSTGIDFRLLLYSASTEYSWPTLLGETATQNGMTSGVTQNIALLSSVAIAEGDFLGVALHAAGTVNLGGFGSCRGAFASGKTFASGAPASLTLGNYGAQVPLTWVS